MNALEYGQMLKELFEDRINSLSITEVYYTTLKNQTITEKVKSKYEILIMETQLCLDFLNQRLDKLNKVLELNKKIQNENVPFNEKIACMVEVSDIMQDL